MIDVSSREENGVQVVVVEGKLIKNNIRYYYVCFFNYDIN